MKNLKPAEIKKILDEYVVGQDETKKVLSVGLYNHLKRISNKSSTEIEKSNILMIGPTGSGKTLLAKTLAKIVDLPFIIADATSLTEAGYIGEDVESMIFKLLKAANMDVKAAQKGIIYLDEIDKIARSEKRAVRDVSKEVVQQALLKIIEGSSIGVLPTSYKKQLQEQIYVDTKDILFIFGGTFNGLDNIINERLNLRRIGFKYNQVEKNQAERVVSEDLKNFGIIPEMIGRIPIISTLEEPTKDMFLESLLLSKNSIIEQFKKLLKSDNVELIVEHEALEEIARLALEKKVGLRGLRAVIESIMLDIMYMIPSSKNVKKVILDKESIIDKSKIKLEIY